MSAPILLAAAATARRGAGAPRELEAKPPAAAAGGGEDATVFRMMLAWHSMSALWFLAPLSAYLSSAFYLTDGWHALCAVAICSAFPLSWHLSFVSVPASAAAPLARMLGLGSTAPLKALHVRIAWPTCAWAALHAGGELVYLASQVRRIGRRGRRGRRGRVGD